MKLLRPRVHFGAVWSDPVYTRKALPIQSNLLTIYELVCNPIRKLPTTCHPCMMRDNAIQYRPTEWLLSWRFYPVEAVYEDITHTHTHTHTQLHMCCRHREAIENFVVVVDHWFI